MNGKQTLSTKKAFSPMISRSNLTRILNVVFAVAVLSVGAWQLYRTSVVPNVLGTTVSPGPSPAATVLKQLEVKGRAPKTGYTRAQFSDGWGDINSCDVRNYILARDLTSVTYIDGTCKVKTGQLQDPYTGKTIEFVRGNGTSDAIQIDHVVALGDAWQKGAQQLSSAQRYSLANDPLELLAVDGPTNQNKGDADAASWLPPNKAFRCSYVARQIAVKYKYHLWVTPAEYTAMAQILTNCPEQATPAV